MMMRKTSLISPTAAGIAVADHRPALHRPDSARTSGRRRHLKQLSLFGDVLERVRTDAWKSPTTAS